jgi:LacI family transcriptional regulator
MTDPLTTAFAAPSRPGVATIIDVAAMAGVSVRTASRVVNKSPLVNAQTRVKVEAAIEALDFSPSSRARGLRSGRSNLIGVIQGDANAHTIGAIQHGIVTSCTAAGFELVVHSASVDDPDLAGNVREFIQRSRVDGVIVLSPTSEEPSLPGVLAALNIPAVALGARAVEGYAGMLVSAEKSAAMAMADHLYALGHRRIGMVTGPASRQSSQERAGGFIAALEARGVQVAPHHIAAGDYSFDGGLAAGHTLLALGDRPDAIFACNDISAIGVLKAATNMGLQVPRDIAIAGFDGSDIAAMVSPSLTTIRRPLQHMARRATDWLIGAINGAPLDMPLAPVELELVVRESTRG